MTVDNAEMIRAVNKYKVKREQVREAQREELDRRTWEERVEAGRAIVLARAERGLSIQTVADIIGVQNRTFIYDMIKAYEAVEPTPEEEPTVETDPHAYEIEFIEDGDTAIVKFAGDEEYYVTVERSGKSVIPDVPEEWADHTKDRRAVYKQVLADIREHFKR